MITFDDIKCYQMLLNAGSITLMLSDVGVITLITLMLLLTVTFAHSKLHYYKNQ